MSLDVRHVYSYAAPLHPQLVARLRELPGIGYGARRGGGQLYLPHNLQWLVDDTLAAWSIPRPKRVQQFGALSPRSWTRAELEERSRASEAHSWMWDETTPTTAEPIRLLPFQIEALQNVGAWDGGHLWQPAGSGKTAESIVWGLLEPGPIVVVTRAPARTTHLREWSRLAAVVPYVYKPSSQVRKKDRFASLDDYLAWCTEDAVRPVIIIGWEQVAALADELIAKVKPTSLILDESHRAKAMRRARWIADRDGVPQRHALQNTSERTWDLAKACERRLCTTATAIRHRTWDLWGQLSLVEPQAWGGTASRFLMRYCDGRPGEHGGIVADGLTNREELVRRLTYTVHRTPHAVTHAQLPPKRREVRWVALGDQVKAFSWNLKREEKKAAMEGNRNRLTEIRLWEAASRKRKHAVQEVRETISDLPRSKVFAVTGRRRDCDELGRQLAGTLTKIPADTPDIMARLASVEGVTANGVTVWCAHGDTNETRRRDMQDAYMAHPGPCVLVGTIDAWGESLNLQDTDLLLVVSLPYTPGQLDQLEGRVHRLGQARPVTVRYLCAEASIDERVAHLLLLKLPAVDYIVGAGALDGLTDQLKGIGNRDEVLEGILDAFDNEDENDG